MTEKTAEPLGAVAGQVERPVSRHSRTLTAGPIAISCMAPEARDCLDDVMAKWRVHWQALPSTHRIADPDDVYGFAYWLLRYSGLVVPANVELTGRPLGGPGA